MLPERLGKVEELYHAAQQRQPAERSAFLAATCRGDTELKRAVESLLAQDSGSTILDQPAAALLPRSSVKHLAPVSGDSDSRAFPTTSEHRIPWWMAVIALSYIATFGLIMYLIIWGPAELHGFVSKFSGDSMVIQSVDADSQVAKGGLRAGDGVLMIDNQYVRTAPDWAEATGNLELGRPQRWASARRSKRHISDS